MKFWVAAVSAVLLASSGWAASKPHVVVLGKWTTIKWQNDESDQQDLKIRALLVDGKVKEFTTGPAHDVTDRTFVVERMVRVNDSLPQEAGATRWSWEKGGWLVVDRVTGRVQPIALPEFDSYHSQASWFRDYAAYCGVSDDGQKAFAVIAQLGRRRVLMKKALAQADLGGCVAPTWQRQPVRVTFSTKDDPKLTFAVSNRSISLATEDEGEGEE